MKRKNEKVPEFDDIIFENRNKNYGAYNLRKQYKTATSLSILGAIAFSAIIMSVLSNTTKEVSASPVPTTVVLVLSDPIIPKVVPPPELKPTVRMVSNIKNLKPVVTDDSTKVTPYLPSNDDLLSTLQNGAVNDSTPVNIAPDPVIPEETKPLISVQEMPEFPGGLEALLNYVGKTLKYPADAQINNIQGKVILKFVVNTDGSVDRIEIIRGIDPLLDNEAIRVVKTLPKFRPGKQDGVPVPVWFLLPINFKIDNN
jgi:periplasmic protein TonB